MKKIKVKFCNLDEKNFFSYSKFILEILKKNYVVEHSEDPDYVFYNESTNEHLRYDCIKIFYTGENICPNFNFCDYAIGFDYMTFGDRFYRLPLYLIATVYQPKELTLAKDIDFTKKLNVSMDELVRKEGFCSFVYSNYLSDNARKEFFDKLSNYKKINSGGAYLNNTGGRTYNKLDFEMKHKFSIAFENSSRSGYTTEKIVTSLMAKTIPIYWGNPDIHKEFNEKRFINCHRYNNFDEVVKRVKEIDSNDTLYLEIINEPVTIPEYDFRHILDGFESFIKNIFDQPIEKAHRINLSKYRQKALNENELTVAKYTELKAMLKCFLSKIYRPFKRIRILELMKENLLKKI